MTVSIANMAQVWMSNTNTYNGIAMSISTMGFGANSRSRLFRLSVDGNTRFDIDANGRVTALDITANTITVNTIIALSSANGITTNVVTTGTLTASGNIGIGTLTPAVSLDMGSKTDSLRLPVGTIAQRPATPTTGMIRFNSSYNDIEVYNGTYWYDVVSGGAVYDGSTAALAAPSALDIKLSTGTNVDGVYWINLPTVGATQIYCLMDDKWAGGGWMMAMKATRGTTFPYSSTYWTAINTLNPSTGLNRNDGDAKFNAFNYHPSKDILALWPDIGQGGMLQNTGCWSWVENNFLMGAKTTLQNFFNTNHQINKSSGKAFGGWGSGVFSSQGGFQWYGFNYTTNGSYRVRWGFAWNNELDQTSNDVSGGIGMERGSYSAGDFITSAQDTTGINRTARVELYIR